MIQLRTVSKNLAILESPTPSLLMGTTKKRSIALSPTVSHSSDVLRLQASKLTICLYRFSNQTVLPERSHAVAARRIYHRTQRLAHPPPFGCRRTSVDI